MFTNLTERLAGLVQQFRGQGRLTEENIADASRQVRMALLEADVALPVVKQFIEKVQVRALGQDVMQSLTPGQAFIKIVHDELVAALGGTSAELNLAAAPPAVIMLAGLQGSGKTTTAAKLARWLSEHNKTVMLVSADVYRPAAIQQLAKLAQDLALPLYPSEVGQDPVFIAQQAVAAAKKSQTEVLIIDTAGRLHIDEAMMQEAAQIHAAVQPIETLFVVDSMLGQDAVNTAQAFNQTLPLTGIILTKTDGDARGGAVLSTRFVTGAPIKFIGTGEKVTAFDRFYPERMASRILGMGDVLSLVEQVSQKVDKAAAQQTLQKLQGKTRFTLEDLLVQFQQLKNMGGITNLLDKLPMPGMKQLGGKMLPQIDDKMFKRMEAIIRSMTPQERRFPAIIKGSRKQRIALGSGTQVQDVNRLLKQFDGMEKMLKRFSKDRGLLNMLRKGKANLPAGF